jgi:hypothetical protein
VHGFVLWNTHDVDTPAWTQVHEPRALVVHFHADAGLANRVGVLVSALALAIATDRALLVDWPPVQAHWHPSRCPSSPSFRQKANSVP